MRESLQPRPRVEQMVEYSRPSTGRARKLRLDLNENTAGCSPKVAEVLCSEISAGRLAIYPEYAEAYDRLAQHFNVSEDEVLFTNGTDEAIQILMHVFVESAAKVIILHPSYSMYRICAELVSARVEAIAYSARTLAFPLEELLGAIGQETRAILIANPNNPTGTATNLNAIKQILHHAPQAAILIDEAYFEFCGVTALPLIHDFPNLFVSRTFSKAYGMAGIRFGCLFSNARNLVFARRVRPPYSVNSLATLAAIAAVNDNEFTIRYVDEVLIARELLYVELKRLGISFYPSQGNFVLMHLGDRASEICAQLRAVGVLVRDRSHELAGCVRVTVGARPQVARFIEELVRLR